MNNIAEEIVQGVNYKTGNWTVICPVCGTSIERCSEVSLNYCAHCGKNLSARKGKMTNYEKIKAMSIEEIAYLLDDENIRMEPCAGPYCPHFENAAEYYCEQDRAVECHKATVNWLKSKAEE